MIKTTRSAGSMKRVKTREKFEEDARKVHGTRYLYYDVTYIKDSQKLEVTCRIHGNFWVTARDHLNGRNCKECSKKTKSRKLTKGREIFCEKANKIHNSLYDYTLVPSKFKVRDKVKIICPIHGVFEQVAYYHLQKNGCTKCHNSQGERLIAAGLQNLGVVFESDKKMSDYSTLESFDFYIEGFGLIIEYDGIQHFQPTAFSSSMVGELAEKAFRSQKERDIRKNIWCNSNGIILLRIPYYMENKISVIIPALIKKMSEESNLPRKVDREYWDNWLLSVYREYL